MKEQVNLPLYVKVEGVPYMRADVAWEMQRAIETALEAVKKYPEHPMTASEVILRTALVNVL